MLSCLLPEDVWTWLVMLGIFMKSMSAEDSEPGCSRVATPPLTRLEMGLWVCDVLIRGFFMGFFDSDVRLTTSVPRKLMKNLGKIYLTGCLQDKLAFWLERIWPIQNSLKLFVSAPDSWSIGALCGPSGSGKSVNMRNLGCEAVLTEWNYGTFWASGGKWGNFPLEGGSGKKHL